MSHFMSERHDRMKQIRLEPQNYRRLKSKAVEMKPPVRVGVLANFAITEWLDTKTDKPNEK
jgi:hypothetical protein